jgi:hypothetical protein
MIHITAIRLTGGEGHEHVTDLQWNSVSTAGQSSRAALIEWLRASSANQAVVADASKHVPLFVVELFNSTPFLRTHADGAWTDHLLRLPRF